LCLGVSVELTPAGMWDDIISGRFPVTHGRCPLIVLQRIGIACTIPDSIPVKIKIRLLSVRDPDLNPPIFYLDNEEGLHKKVNRKDPKLSPE
jgi:hypothetical protein